MGVQTEANDGKNRAGISPETADGEQSLQTDQERLREIVAQYEEQKGSVHVDAVIGMLGAIEKRLGATLTLEYARNMLGELSNLAKTIQGKL